jgi:hypothetical protein
MENILGRGFGIGIIQINFDLAKLGKVIDGFFDIMEFEFLTFDYFDYWLGDGNFILLSI